LSIWDWFTFFFLPLAAPFPSPLWGPSIQNGLVNLSFTNFSLMLLAQVCTQHSGVMVTIPEEMDLGQEVKDNDLHMIDIIMWGNRTLTTSVFGLIINNLDFESNNMYKTGHDSPRIEYYYLVLSLINSLEPKA
jgi:hypothetical protein